MSRIISNITNHIKNHEKQNFNKKRQSIDTNIEMNQMMRLSDKDLKVVIVKMILQTTTNFLKFFEKMEKLSKEICF